MVGRAVRLQRRRDPAHRNPPTATRSGRPPVCRGGARAVRRHAQGACQQRDGRLWPRWNSRWSWSSTDRRPRLLAVDWAVDEASRHGLPLRLVHASLWEGQERARPSFGTDRPAGEVRHARWGKTDWAELSEKVPAGLALRNPLQAQSVRAVLSGGTRWAARTRWSCGSGRGGSPSARRVGRRGTGRVRPRRWCERGADGVGRCWSR